MISARLCCFLLGLGLRSYSTLLVNRSRLDDFGADFVTRATRRQSFQNIIHIFRLAAGFSSMVS
jgi:hypothetical protein